MKLGLKKLKMCLAIPGKIVEIDGENVVVDYQAEKRIANIGLVDDLKLGEYVIINGGFIIKRVDKESAEKLYCELKDVGKNDK